MRLLEFIHSLQEAKFRKPIIMFHGTTTEKLPSILKHGVLPRAAERVWATDPQVTPHQFSRVSLPGSYWTSNLMTASSSATTAKNKFGGNALIVVAQISEGSAHADEDSVNYWLRDALPRMYQEIFGRGIAADAAPKSAALLYWVDHPEAQNMMVEEFAKIFHNRMAINPEKQPINKQLFKQILEAMMLRSLAYAKEHEQGRFYRDQWVAAYEEKVGEIPPLSEIENKLLDLRDKLTQIYRKTAYKGEEGQYLHTLRIPEPVNYRGANKIIAIVEEPPYTGVKDRQPVILHYGNPQQIPQEFFSQWRERIGSFPGLVDRTESHLLIEPDEERKAS